jgi:hypothetical protein
MVQHIEFEKKAGEKLGKWGALGTKHPCGGEQLTNSLSILRFTHLRSACARSVFFPFRHIPHFTNAHISSAIVMIDLRSRHVNWRQDPLEAGSPE